VDQFALGMRKVGSNILLVCLCVAYMTTTFLVMTELFQTGIGQPGYKAYALLSGSSKEIPKRTLMPRRHLPLVNSASFLLDLERPSVASWGVHQAVVPIPRHLLLSLQRFLLYTSLGDRSPPVA
jgi:hypothetical protein